VGGEREPGERVTTAPAWAAALSEHEAVLAGFLAETGRVPPERWHLPAAPGRWSPAEEVLHVALSYEFGCAAVTEGAAMRLRVPSVGAWFARHVLLPRLLRAGTFPRGATAPSEVAPSPDEARTLTIADARARLARAAETAARLLRTAEGRRPVVRVTHAYFGPLTPYAALRLLSAHTQHHARRLTALHAGAPDAPRSSLGG
jgi:hypothetical protein